MISNNNTLPMTRYPQRWLWLVMISLFLSWCPITHAASHSQYPPFSIHNIEEETDHMAQQIAQYIQLQERSCDTALKDYKAGTLGSSLGIIDRMNDKPSLKDTSHLTQVRSAIDSMSLLEMIKTYSQEKDYGVLSPLQEIKGYESLQQEITKGIETISDHLQNVNLISLTLYDKGEKERSYFYQKIGKKLNFIQVIEQSNNPIEDKKRFDTICAAQKAKIEASLAKNVIQVVARAYWGKEECKKISMFNRCLQSLDTHINLTSFQKEVNIATNLQTVKTTVSQKIEKIQIKTKDNNASAEEIAKSLVQMEEIKTVFTGKEKAMLDEIKDKMESIFRHCNAHNKKAFKLLPSALQDDPSGIGGRILDSSPFFKSWKILLLNQKTKAYDIDYVLEEIRGDGLGKEKLRACYKQCWRTYYDVIKNTIHGTYDMNKLLTAIQELGGKAPIQKMGTKIKWRTNLCNVVLPQLIGYIFALWALQEREEEENREEAILQPHPAQLVSIFRLLGIDAAKYHKQPVNQLVQIGTGEGKSVVMAVLASVFALIGFEVTCGCYSPYLKERDCQAFDNLFCGLNVAPYIQYGTFNDIAESIINAQGNVRRQVSQRFIRDEEEEKKDGENAQGDSYKSPTQQKRPRIFIVDEVDVFFHKNFYGNIYQLTVPLKHPTITALIQYIWDNYRENASLAKAKISAIQSSKPYQTCCKGPFKHWEPLLEEKLKELLYDLQYFKKDHNYIVHKNKIGYKELDSVSYNVCMGYKTMFAYFYEHAQDPNKITQKSLESNISINIQCGRISYAALPTEYDRILGVTGTLKQMSLAQKKTVKDKYKVEKSTYMPSLYGPNKLKFTGIDIVPTRDYLPTIAKRIHEGLIGTRGGHCAVLVFFENQKVLEAFMATDEYNLIEADKQTMTEELSDREKEERVKNATRQNSLTLAVRAFGRGTDYKCFDHVVNSNGGVQLIVTFFPEEPSEHKQIEGRTARQADNGSICYVLAEDKLEQFGFSEDEIKKLKEETDATKKDKIRKKRDAVFNTKCTEDTAAMKKVQEEHQKSKQFIQDLFDQKESNIKKYLLAHNRGPAMLSASRTVVLMDATLSMGALLQKAKNSVYEMFVRMRKILQEKNYDPQCFELQFAVYRNYNAPEDQLLCHSSWTFKPEELKKFMATVDPAYGWGNEAIEVGLAHVIKSHQAKKVTQIILIGDARANTKKEVTDKRKNHGENYWAQFSHFATSTYYKDELAELKKQKVPVHAFYTTNTWFYNKARLKAHYKEIADITGGKTGYLDINNADKGTEELLKIVSESVLASIGGSKLVAAYKKAYPKAYV